MGSTISIDKHVSNLDDLLDISPNYYSKIKFESKISPHITQHLKIWKFFEDNKNVDLIKTLPVPLANIQTSGFNFSSEESYLILLIYKSHAEEQCELVNFPHSLWGVVESVSNLTPRGLISTFSSSFDNCSFNSPEFENLYVESLDSFLLSKRQQSNSKFKYLLFVWNGKNASPLVKALVLTKGYELDTLLNRAKDTLLEVLFSGGVIRRKKLQRGSVLVFDEVISNNMTSHLEEANRQQQIFKTQPQQKTTSNQSLIRACETVYLLRWWLPEESLMNSVEKTVNSVKFPRFASLLYAETGEPISKKKKQMNSQSKGKERNHEYFSRFIDIDAELNVSGSQMEEKENSSAGGNEIVPPLDFKSKNTAPPISKPVLPKLMFSMQKKPSPAENSEDTQEVMMIKEKKGALNLNLDNLPNSEDSPPKKKGPIIPGLAMGSVMSSQSMSTKVPSLLSSVQEPLQQIELSRKGEVQRRDHILEEDPNFENEDSPYSSHSNSSPSKGISPPGLRLGNLKTREEERLELQGNLEKINADENYVIRDTNRRTLENEFYKDQCSKVLDFLYLGGDTVAQNKELLEKIGITHIINCSGDYSDNYFPEVFQYKRYYLKDSVRENIECLFYEAIDFISSARMGGGKVYVHCVQGVSRSATICLAFLIFSEKMNCKEAFDYLQNLRKIANPNINFNAQLFWWHMRLFQDYSALPVAPRVFVIGSHQVEDPKKVVSRLLMEHMYGKTSGKLLDQRGIFIVQNVERIYVWIGNHLKGKNEKIFLEKAKETIQLIQKHEKAPNIVEYVRAEHEPMQFWKMWNLSQAPEIKYQNVEDWDFWFEDVELADQNKPNEPPLVYAMNKCRGNGNYEEDIQAMKANKPRLYTYPHYEGYTTVFDFDDLAEDSLLCLCIKPQNKLYLWCGSQFEESPEISKTEFWEQAKNHCWNEGLEDIEEKIEEQENESESFMEYFDN